MGRALARVHAIDPAPLTKLVEIDQVAFYTDALDSLGQPHPVLELVRNWLIDHRPTPGRAAVVHGDFRLGNLIVGTTGLNAVIDWELAHIGDPMEDLGWLCVKAWRFGQGPPVAGVGQYDELFAAYEAAAEVTIDPGSHALVGGARHLEVGDHVHPPGQRPPVGREPQPRTGGDRPSRVRERIRPVALAGREVVMAAPHDAPTAAQLIEAVREWLERDVAASTEGRLKFHARVAANVLAIVERELDLGGLQATEHAARLARLGVPDDAALAAGIRRHEFDDRLDEVRELLLSSVIDKLLVANPGYLNGAG